MGFLQYPFVFNKSSVFYVKFEQILEFFMLWYTVSVVIFHPYWVRWQILHPFWVKSCHSFHSLKAEKGPMSFTFRHTHPGKVESKSPPRGAYPRWRSWRSWGSRRGWRSWRSWRSLVKLEGWVVVARSMNADHARIRTFFRSLSGRSQCSWHQ